MFSDWKIPAFVGLLVVMTVVRFLGLERSPPGFSTDETSNAAHMICLAQVGTNALGEPHPFYSPQFESAHQTVAGQIPPTHLYAGALWLTIFGYSVGSLRALSAFSLLLTTWGVFALAGRYLGVRTAVLSAFMLALSPFAFQLGRISGMAALGPPLIVFGCYFFVRRERWASVLSALCLVAALYSYDAAKVQVAFLLLGLFWLQRAHRSPAQRAIFWWVGGIALLPLLYHFALVTGAHQRASRLSIFASEFVKDRSVLFPFRVFLDNLWAHLSPEFLFFSGDPNRRHSTQFVGEMSWVESLVWLGLLWVVARDRIQERKTMTLPEKGGRDFLLFCFFGFIVGLVPSALTWEGQPHALRASGALPFLAILSGFALELLEPAFKRTFAVTWAVAVLFCACYLYDYFAHYPQRSASAWDVTLRQAAEQARDSGDWDGFLRAHGDYPKVSLQYYLMRYRGDSCRSSQAALALVPQSH